MYINTIFITVYFFLWKSGTIMLLV